MSYTIFLVEDEPNLNRLLTSYLEKEGWQVTSFLTGRSAQEAIGQKPHLWILDIMLPDLDGYQLIAEIKAFSPQVPVIFISARDSDLDRIVGLEKGSDDYLPKPFMPRELIIRVGKLLERVYGAKSSPPGELLLLEVHPYRIDRRGRTVLLEQRKIELTSREFDLLVYLSEHQGLALAREQILNRLWGKSYYGSDRVVDDLVRRLRKKMPALEIETIYGYGYRLVIGG